MRIYVDIDGTVAESHGLDYSTAKPIPERISEINKLYDQGHEVYYWTARGTMSGIDYTELTSTQLDNWGAKRTALIMGKPAFDVFIDDKAFNSDNFKQFLNVCQEKEHQNTNAKK